MIGKSTHQDNPGDARSAKRQLGKVNFNLISSSIISTEGYDYAALFGDDHTRFRWLYGLKTEDGVKAVAQQWMAEIADLREKCPLLVGMRDNAGVNKSKELSGYFTSMAVENH